MLSGGILMNDFLEPFLMIFGQNKYTNLRRYGTIFFHQTDFSLRKVVKLTVSCIIKYI